MEDDKKSVLRHLPLGTVEQQARFRERAIAIESELAASQEAI